MELTNHLLKNNLSKKEDILFRFLEIYNMFLEEDKRAINSELQLIFFYITEDAPTNKVIIQKMGKSDSHIYLLNNKLKNKGWLEGSYKDIALNEDLLKIKDLYKNNKINLELIDI